MKLKTLIRWEQLRGKPYAGIDLADEDDFNALLYVRALEKGTARGYTLGTFRKVMQRAPRQLADLVEEMRREADFNAQFVRRQTGGEESKEAGEPRPLSQTAAWLVASGMDAHFVMEELEVPDLPAFIEAYAEARRERMEEARLWTWFTVRPHCAKDWPRDPSELYPFPWDIRRADDADTALRADEIARFEAFMRTKERRNEE